MDPNHLNAKDPKRFIYKIEMQANLKSKWYEA